MNEIGKPRHRKERASGNADRPQPPEVSASADGDTAAGGLPPAHRQTRRPGREPWMEFKEVSTFPAITESTDRLVHALQGRLTGGLSPASIVLAYLDWAVHLGNSIGKVNEMTQNAMAKSYRFALYAARASTKPETEPFIEPLPQDTRFASPAWKDFPYNIYAQSFLLVEQWWHYATSDVRGVSRHHQQVVSFAARQALDVLAPSNFAWSNPDVVKATLQQGGNNLLRGAEKFFDDLGSQLTGQPPSVGDEFEIGVDLACTPGKVVYRNQIIELIQYTPSTALVQAEPVLIVPAWIMKYYILDLSPHNSLVRYLLSRGFTVFMISWRNPGPAERNFGMVDYMRDGVMDSIAAVSAICQDHKLHAVGYCLGGTLLSIAAATMARDGDHRLQSVTLLAAQTDFEEAGEIMLFIDESQVTFLEDMMWDQGYLDTRQMSGAFQMLRSNDLIWSRLIREYFLGEPEHPNDLMAWNADTTRMPYHMHSGYLRHLFLDNDLAKGRFQVDGRPIALTDIRAPICAVGTAKDHVAPWKSVFKIGLLTDTEVTFVLTAGGHNAGIVSEPGHPHRSFQMSTHQDLDRYIDPESWARVTPRQEGSWWPAWADWLEMRSSGRTTPPPMGLPGSHYVALYDAPGEYVLMR